MHDKEGEEESEKEVGDLEAVARPAILSMVMHEGPPGLS